MSRSSTKISATSGNAAFALREAVTGADLAACRELFVEYQRSLGASVCFQDFDRDLASLPGDYAPPRGRLILATFAAAPAGCVALRPLFHRDAEMKRLYVRSQHRGAGLGRLLATTIIGAARDLGYETLKLDTLPEMKAAQRMYGKLGFRATAAYNDHPGVRFLALDLR